MHKPTRATIGTISLLRERASIRSTVLVLALLGVLAATASCSHDPFEDYEIAAVELRSAPRLEFVRAHNGMKFLQVLFDFKNDSGETLVLRALDFSLRDTQGKHYPFSAQVLDMGQAFHTAESFLESGQVKSGSVVFMIPRKAVPKELVFRFEVEGGLVVRFDEKQASLTEGDPRWD
jgi:hypothetical protein